jgi:hypothetical protein
MSTPLANIHDGFFKQVLGDQQTAGIFLREHLPPKLSELLAPSAPEPMPGSFVDEELRQHHSDLLFRVQLNTGGDAFAYVLMEHKSSPDPVARLQLLRYIVRILVKWYEQNGQQLPLPPVLPLLVHQGPDGWKSSCEFTDLFGPAPEILRPYLPSFRHALVDLAHIDNDALSSQPRLRACLKAMKYVLRPDLAKHVRALLAEAGLLDVLDVLRILTYIDLGPIPVSL